jgi:hypothetical protein
MGITHMDTTIRTAITDHIRTMATIALTTGTADIATIGATTVPITTIGTKLMWGSRNPKPSWLESNLEPVCFSGALCRQGQKKKARPLLL